MQFIDKEMIDGLPMALIQTGVETAYRTANEKSFNMPDRMHIHDDENVLLLMPCFSEKYFATKLVSVFPQAVEHGLPMVNGVLVLNSNSTGEPLAIMDGAAVTAHRTGAVGGVAVKYLAPENISRAGVIGAGVQGYFQSKYLIFNRKIATLFIHDKSAQKAEQLVQKLKTEHNDIEFIVAQTAEEVVINSQVVVTATTSNTPLFRENLPTTDSKLFIGIGSYTPQMKEFPDDIISNAQKVYVDTLFAIKESGDISIPIASKIVEKDKIEEFSILVEKSPASHSGYVLFKSVGMALFDLSVASLIYETLNR